MKSIKLFFGLVAALFMTVTSQMGAQAQIPYTVSSAPDTGNKGGRWDADTKWYFIQFPNRDAHHTNGYLATEGSEYINSDGQLLLNGTTKPQSSAGLWCIVGDETKGYSFYNRKTGVNKVLSMTQDGVAKVLEVGTADQVQAFDYAASTHPTTYRGKATFKFHGSTNSYWNNSDGNPKCHLAVWKSDNGLSDAGSAVDVIAATYDELVMMGLKIKVSTESEKFYYVIKNKRSGKYASFNGNAGLSQVAFDNLSQSSIWYVTADGAGYKMHNLATAKLVNGNGMDADGCTMYIEENILCPGYFCVSKSSIYDANCWDDANNHTTIGYYAPEAGDYEGTSWAFEEAYPSVAKTKLACLLTTAKNSVGSNPGCYPQSAVDEAKAVFDNSAATEDDLTAAATALSNALILPVAGKYYTITSAYTEYEKKQGKTMSAYVDGTTLKWKATDLNDDSFYWQIYLQGDKYVFKNYGTQTYISTYASNQFSTGETPADNTGFTWFDGGICNVKVAGGNFHTNVHNSGSGTGNTIIQYGSGASGASAWYIKEVKSPLLQKAIVALQAKVDEYNAYSGNKLGVNPGQYKPEGHTLEEFTQAIANAKALLDSGSEDEAAYNSMLGTFESYNFTFVKNEMEVGAYYRFQNTARKTWASIEKKNEKMGTSQMRCQADDERNPLQIWKLEKDGDNYFLVNVASGLYPQYVNGGGDATTDMGAKNADYKFTWKILSEASESAMPVHLIKFGGRQVNVEENGNMNWWTAENARFYIWKVEKTDQELLELVNNWARDHYTASNAATKIDVTPGVKQVISPNDFAAPEVVNAAVDALHAYTGAANPTLEQAQALYRSYYIVKTYWNAATTYGGLLSVPYTLKAKYGTLILPINYTRPEHVKLYSCEADVNGVLTLVEFTGTQPKNKPFIVEYTDVATLPTTEAAYTYQFIGYKSGAATTNKTEGWLTGVLEENQYVPAGGYILAKKDGVLGFYQVGADNVKAAAKYKCYLQPTSQTSAQLAYFFNRDEATTAITNLLNGGENGKVEIYDLSGKRLNNLQKGVNIVNGKKIIVR